MRGPHLIRTPVVLPPDKHEHGEDECPVCYVSTSSSGPRAAVTCKVCKHAVCGECDTQMTHAGHERCPMCRAPRPKRSTLPLAVLLHTFHCTDADCRSPQCADTKLVLLRMEVHAEHCTRPFHGLGGPDECNVCKLWRMLHSSRPPPAPEVVMLQEAQAAAAAAITAAGVALTAAAAVSVHPGAQEMQGFEEEEAGAASDLERRNPVAVRAWIRSLPPAQVRRMLLSHVRQCRNLQCKPCRELRERIRIRVAAS